MGIQGVLAQVDELCQAVTIALQNAEFYTFSTLIIAVLLTWSLFGGKSDFGWYTWTEQLTADRVYLLQATIWMCKMLSVVVTLLIIALIAALLGFGGIAGAAVGIAKIVFFVALVLFVISLIVGGMRGGLGRWGF
jgi:uncharacterized membrane protein YtjA (UPF0391 family)